MENQSTGTSSKLFWVLLFSAAMAYLESAIVVYLRLLYYPQGFDFPLTVVPQAVLFTEWGREAATLIMLVALGLFCGRSRLERFAYLLLAFGIWDVMYYVWLKVLIGWPNSLLTWDILFLVPLPWVGPVLAPILVSLAMIGAGLWVIAAENRGIILHFPRWAWWGEIVAGFLIILAFIWDAKNVTFGGYPHPYRWDLFAVGWLGGLSLFFIQMRKSRSC